MVQLDDLMTRHLAQTFPGDVAKGDSYGGVDAVMVGADIYGWALTVAKGGQLRADQRKGLAEATAALKATIDEFPESARPYYQLVVEIGEAALKQ